MATKVFTTMGGPCPYGLGHERDSAGCRKCEHYYREGTGTFFWCTHPDSGKEHKKPEKRKRGRPPVKVTKTPVNQRKDKNI